MKRTKRLLGLLMAGLMAFLPALQALAKDCDAAVMDPAPVLFPGDTLTGISVPVTVDGVPVDLGAEAPAAWTNEETGRVYRAGMAEDGSIALTPVGYELTVKGGVSSAGDETTGPIGGHDKDAEDSAEAPETDGQKKDRAYYPENTLVKLKADDPAEGMEFDKWTVEEGTVVLEDETNSETTVMMPQEKVVIVAGYRQIQTETEPVTEPPAEPSPDAGVDSGPEGTPEMTDPGAEIVPEGSELPGMEIVPEGSDFPGTEIVPEGSDFPDAGLPQEGMGGEPVDGQDQAPVPEIADGQGQVPVPEIAGGQDQAPAPEIVDGQTQTPAPDVMTDPNVIVIPEAPDGSDNEANPDGGLSQNDGMNQDGAETSGDSIWSGIDEGAIDTTTSNTSGFGEPEVFVPITDVPQTDGDEPDGNESDGADLPQADGDGLDGDGLPQEQGEEDSVQKYRLDVYYGTVTAGDAGEDVQGSETEQNAYAAGTLITVTADDYTENGYHFAKWSVTPEEMVWLQETDDPATVSFVMPEADIMIMADYVDGDGYPVADPDVKPSTGETQPESEPETQPETQSETQSESEPETQSETQPETQSETQAETQLTEAAVNEVSVENGTIVTEEGPVDEADFEENATVTVTADDRTDEGLEFTEWSVDSENIMLADATANEITFVMPSESVSLTANYAEAAVIITMMNGSIVKNESGTETLMPQDKVDPTQPLTLQADAPKTGMKFARWTAKKADDSTPLAETCFSPLNEARTTFTLPEDATGEIIVTAEYELVQYEVTVKNGYTDLDGDVAVMGTEVEITADEAPEGKEFDYWKVKAGNVTLADVHAETTTFTMPASDVKLVAKYKLKEYYVTVQNGYADSSMHYMGEQVTVYSNYPASGREFDQWKAVSGKVSFGDASRWKTTFTMPASDVTVSATYKDGPSPNNNQIWDIVAGGEYITDSTIKFTAVGAGMENTNPNPGDYRYRPAGYQIGNVTGSWQASPYTTSMSIKARGDYTLKVNFNKDVFDGNAWVQDGTTDTKSVTFRVLTPAEAVATGDDTPVAGMMALAVVSCLVFLTLLAAAVRRRRGA